MNPSIMFHHFHSDIHYKSQGSITPEDLYILLDELEKKYKIIDPTEFQEKYLKNNLKKNEIVLTFDDALLCQYELAWPVLVSKNLNAFWFIYSSGVKDHEGNFEIYRYFRTEFFKNLDDFYKKFNIKLETQGFDIVKYKKKFFQMEYLAEFIFYSESDRFFRYLRDIVLNESTYFNIMDGLMDDLEANKDIIKMKLWMSERDVKKLYESGSLIGAHSYNHPTKMNSFTKEEQYLEYERNIEHLKSITGVRPEAMAHPCNSYNHETLDILRDLGLKIGFCSNNLSQEKSNFELPRIDHTLILNN